MGLSGALQIGRSALLTSQSALEVVGHNLANMATPGYHRQTVAIAPIRSQEIQQGIFVGRGVTLEAITRRIDEALEARLRGSIADQSYSLARQDLLRQVESVHNEFSDADLSTKLSAFFNAWSQLANNPQDLSLRSLVTDEATALAAFLQGLRGELIRLRTQLDKTAENTASQVDSLLSQIEDLNDRVAVADQGAGGATALRDQRGLVLSELARYLDVSTIEQANGEVDVFVGSLPLVLNGVSRGVEIRSRSVNGEIEVDLVITQDQNPLDISSGELGSIVGFRQQDMDEAIETLNTFTNQLIFKVNRLHSQGQGTQFFDSVTGTVKVSDPALALNDAILDLDFVPQHGSFMLHVTQKSTGSRLSSMHSIDLDGISAATDTTLASLAAAIDAAANVNATVTADGRLQITADADFQISFSDDSSGVLASLGINTLFIGGNAFDIGVNPVATQQPALVAAALGHAPADNRTALAIAALRDQGVDDLSGFSLTDYWNRHVEDFAIRLGRAREAVESDTVVRENLEAQQQAVSGVNADEEAVKLIQYQRVYQASARFIAVVDELYRTLLGLI